MPLPLRRRCCGGNLEYVRSLSRCKKWASSGGKSNVFVIDGGAFFKGPKMGPWLRYEDQTFANPNRSKSVKRYLAGFNWMPYINNFNIKAAYVHVKPEVGKSTAEYILQMQFFIY